MTSMLERSPSAFSVRTEPVEAPALPETRDRGRRRRRSGRARRWGVFLAACGAALLCVLLFAFVVTRPARIDPASARVELGESLGLLKLGNISAARLHAQAAIKADPDWGLAHAVLARVFLALGDGVAAEGELARARAAGFDGERAHQLYAHAWLLQGDPKRALAEAGKAQPRYAGYAARVAARALAAQGDLPGAQRMLAAVLATTPGDSAGWSDLGRIRYASGDLAGAIDAATRAIALDRNNIEALTLRGELVRGQYGLVAALPWFEEALKRDAYFHPALIEYAGTLGDVGRYGDMLLATRKALAAQPGSPQAYYLQAVLAARAGNFDLARTLMDRTAGKVSGMPGALLLGGTLSYQAGAYEQAIEQFRQLVGRQPMNITARRLLGAALLRSGDAKGALDMLRPVALRGDADSYTLSLVARAFERTGERDWSGRFLDRAAWPSREGSSPFGTDDSLPILTVAANEEPDDPVRRVSYLRGLIDSGDAGDALVQAHALARDNPGAPAAHLAVGDTLMVLGRYGDAATAYARAADIHFDEPTMLRAVDALDHAGRRPDAANVLALFLSQNPQNVAGLRLAAHWQIAAGEWDTAIETLEGLRQRIGNRDAALLAELAYAYVGADDTETGLVYAKAAYALAPMNPATTDAYGWALYQSGRNGGAVQLLEKAVSIAPGHAVLRWHLGQVYADLGRKAEAVAEVKAALGDSSFQDRDAAQAVLKTLGS
ncbi:FOG: TPR repeat [hydrothermal vent metagenome]|jgi:tetratricopeptide (TPR) repeat protein|uniref:FOG: TPR repeat n=1 Tax=hydrothermal vent metagenome TaxID=652676 RepID=A0A160TLS6_9ZZZZ